MRQERESGKSSYAARLVLDVLLAAFILAGVISLGSGIVHERQFPPPSRVQLGSRAAKATMQHAQPSLPFSPPTYIDVPSISVRSSLTYTGLNADGTPAIPVGADMDKAAWLETSAAPGQTGTAVIIGHVDTIRSGPSVFYNLGKLAPGDTVYVRRQDNRTAIFKVDKVQVYDKTKFPSTEVYGKASTPVLRLITCTGEWDASAHQYTQNLVAFANLSNVQ